MDGPTKESVDLVLPRKNSFWRFWPSACRAEKISAAVVTKATPRILNKKLRELRCKDVQKILRAFLSEPLNLALFLWCLVMGIPFIVALLINVGALDSAIPNPNTRHDVSYYMNAVIAGLYSLLCLCLHVFFCRQAWQLYRWHPDDIAAIRAAYCKRGTRKPYEWAHVSFVLFWLHAMCFVSYAFTILYFVDMPSNSHKVAAVSITCALSFVFPAISGIYQALSPLNRSYPQLEGAVDVQADAEQITESLLSFSVSGVPVENPEWDGGVVGGFCLEPRTALLSCLWPCCMFGANVEHLLLGHRIFECAMLAVSTLGPVLIFESAAHVVKGSRAMRYSLVGAGLASGLLGFVYGGFWRARMRRAFGLPAGCRWGCGSAYWTDLLTWIFCWGCALAQEVRTAEQYDVEDLGFSKNPKSEGLDPSLQASVNFPRPVPVTASPDAAPN